MSRDIDGIHHIGIISRDLDTAVASYQKLGFVFTPPSLPKIPLIPGGVPEVLGVANRCAIFQDGYLEILGVVDAARWAAISPAQRGPFDIDAPLRRYAGLHVLHFGSNDLDAVHSRLAAGGLQPSAIRPFQRTVDTPDGPRLMRARCLSFPAGANPEALLQIAQHETRALVLQPRFMHHRNGAVAISEVIVCVADPDTVAAKYAAYTDHSVRRSGFLRIVDVGAARVIVISPDRLEDVAPGHAASVLPFLAGFTVKADLAVTADLFRQQGVTFQFHGARILVSAREGCGSAVLFERPDDSR